MIYLHIDMRDSLEIYGNDSAISLRFTRRVNSAENVLNKLRQPKRNKFIHKIRVTYQVQNKRS